jgi:hypothetical protein
LRLVACRVGIPDKCCVVASRERTVKRRADTRVGLGSDHHEPPDAQVRQHGFECGVFERVAIVLFDERFGLTGRQFLDDPPAVAAPKDLLVGVLDPDDRNIFPTCPIDKGADVRDDGVTLVRRSTTQFCTSMTRSPVFGRFCRVVMPTTVDLRTDVLRSM